MRTGYAFLVALSLSLTSGARPNFYLQDEWIGEQFYSGWNWETEDDPTHGRVNYVSLAEARGKNLTYGAVVPPLFRSTLAESYLLFYFSSGERGVHHACGRLVLRRPLRARS